VTRRDIADIAAKLLGGAAGVLLVGLLIGGTVGQVLVYSAGLIALAFLALAVVYLVGRVR
jgi:hypothetical protein